MGAQAMVPLSELEGQLEISRVDLLLLMRRLGLEPLRRGMRIFLGLSDAQRLIQYLDATGGAEAIPADLQSSPPPASPAPLSPAEAWEQPQRLVSLRRLRERVDLLEQLLRTQIELDSRQLCEVLELRRLPPLQRDETGVFFERYGLRFWRRMRAGQRVGWKVTYGDAVVSHDE
jgi:hypothetical protein